MKKRKTRKIKPAGIGLMVMALMLLAACAGPSTRVLPYESKSAVAERPEEIVPLLADANPFYMQETLAYLSVGPRVSGSEEEKQAVAYLQQLLKDYGYTVEVQPVRLDQDEQMGPSVNYGLNLVATKNAAAPDSDILIIGAGHGTVADSPGAGSSGAALATWLECARLLAELPTDTQIRFVSFTGSEETYSGSRAYVQSMKPEERRRTIGVIQLDELGDKNQKDVLIGSLDGNPVMVGDLLQEFAADSLQMVWPYQLKQGSDYLSFVQNQIPAVSISQPWHAFEYHLPQDRAEIIGVEQLVPIVDTVTEAAAWIMSSETPSLIAKSRFINNLQSDVYVQQPYRLFPFGEEPELISQQLQMEGKLISSVIDGGGILVDTYQYRMKWFGVDQVILTDYYYRDKKLDTISIDADGAGVTFEEMKERLQNCYGEPNGENQSPYGTEYDWANSVYGTFYALIPTADGFDLDIRLYPVSWNLIARYQPANMPLDHIGGEFRRYQDLLKLAGDIFGETFAGQVAYVDIYTDGIGHTAGYIQRSEPEPDPEAEDQPVLYMMGIDGEEALLFDGSYRDYPETVKLLVEYYGQMLMQESDPAILENYEAAFFDGREAADFAKSFRLFVLSQKPETIIHESDERIRFFYDYESFVAERTRIREQLGLVRDLPEEGNDAGEN